MIRIVTSQVMTAEDGSKAYLAEIYGTSEDDKPVAGFVTGSAFMEVDTGNIYVYNEDGETWEMMFNIKDSGGGTQ